MKERYTILIRSAEKSDAKFFAESLYAQFAFHKKFNSDYAVHKQAFYVKFFNLNDIIFIAEVHGIPIGLIHGKIISKQIENVSKYALLKDIFIIENERGSGVGDLLFKKFINFVRKADVHSIELTVDCKNIQAQEFWLKHKFIEKSKRMSKKI